MPFFTQGPEEYPSIQAQGALADSKTFGQSLGATMEKAVMGMPIIRLPNAIYRWEEGHRAPDERGGKRLSVQQANDLYGIKADQYGEDNALVFHKPVTEALASDLYRSKVRQIKWAQTIEAGPQNIAAKAGLVVAGEIPSFLDPLNVAAGVFLPGVGEARYGIMLSHAASRAEALGAGSLARGLSRAASLNERVGTALSSNYLGQIAQKASGGMASAAAMEPLNAALDRSEYNDWSMSEALRNIAFGGLDSGGLHMLLSPLALLKHHEMTLAHLNHEKAPASEDNFSPPSLKGPLSGTLSKTGHDGAVTERGEASQTSPLCPSAPIEKDRFYGADEEAPLRTDFHLWQVQHEMLKDDEEGLFSQAAREEARQEKAAIIDRQQREFSQRKLAQAQQEQTALKAEQERLSYPVAIRSDITTYERYRAIENDLRQQGLTRKKRSMLEHEKSLLEGVSPSPLQEEPAAQAPQETGQNLTEQTLRQNMLGSVIARHEARLALPEFRPSSPAEDSGFQRRLAHLASRRAVMTAHMEKILQNYGRKMGLSLEEPDLKAALKSLLGSEPPSDAGAQLFTALKGGQDSWQAYQEALTKQTGEAEKQAVFTAPESTAKALESNDLQPDHFVPSPESLRLEMAAPEMRDAVIRESLAALMQGRGTVAPDYLNVMETARFIDPEKVRAMFGRESGAAQSHDYKAALDRVDELAQKSGMTLTDYERYHAALAVYDGKNVESTLREAETSRILNTDYEAASLSLAHPKTSSLEQNARRGDWQAVYDALLMEQQARSLQAGRDLAEKITAFDDDTPDLAASRAALRENEAQAPDVSTEDIGKAIKEAQRQVEMLHTDDPYETSREDVSDPATIDAAKARIKEGLPPKYLTAKNRHEKEFLERGRNIL